MFNFATLYALDNLGETLEKDTKEWGNLGIVQIVLTDAEKNLQQKEKEVARTLSNYSHNTHRL